MPRRTIGRPHPRFLGVASRARHVSATRGQVNFVNLYSLNVLGKVVSAWILDPQLGDISINLTLDGSNVTGWSTTMGTKPVNLTELTNPPTWDPTLFGGYGGVVFDGNAQILSASGGNIANWPTQAQDCYLIAAVSQDAPVDGADRLALVYGGGGFGVAKRSIGRVSDMFGAKINASNILSGLGLIGGYAIGIHIVVGGNTTLYLNDAQVFSVVTPTHTFDLESAALGAGLGGGFQWKGAIAAAAILSSSTTEAEFLGLLDEFAKRVG